MLYDNDDKHDDARGPDDKPMLMVIMMTMMVMLTMNMKMKMKMTMMMIVNKMMMID